MNNPESMSELARRWTAVQPAVASYISFAIRDFNDAQDVLQDVASALVVAFDRYDSSQPFLPWALGVARHKILDHRRKHAADKLVLSAAALEQVAQAYCRVGERFDLWQEALEYCLQKVPEKSRQLLRLRYEEDRKPGQIADDLNAGVSAVKMNLHRIRLLLRQCMEARIADGRATL